MHVRPSVWIWYETLESTCPASIMAGEDDSLKKKNCDKDRKGEGQMSAYILNGGASCCCTATLQAGFDPESIQPQQKYLTLRMNMCVLHIWFHTSLTQ